MALPEFLKGSSELSVSGPKVIATFDIFGLKINFTETIILEWIVMAIILGAAFFLTRNLKVHNISKRQVIAEMAVEAITNLVCSTMGEKWKHYTPYIATQFTFLICGSLLSLTGLRAVTSDFSVMIAWALVSFVLITATKIRSGGIGGYFKGMLDPVPVMLPMNIVSEFATPVSLAFRHFGNIAGGGVIMALVYCGLTGASHAIGLDIPILTVGIPAVLSLYFDLFSDFIQAFIFCMLTMVFISNAADDGETA